MQISENWHHYGKGPLYFLREAWLRQLLCETRLSFYLIIHYLQFLILKSFHICENTILNATSREHRVELNVVWESSCFVYLISSLFSWPFMAHCGWVLNRSDITSPFVALINNTFIWVLNQTGNRFLQFNTCRLPELWQVSDCPCALHIFCCHTDYI